MELVGKTIAKVTEVWEKTTQVLFTDGTWMLMHSDSALEHSEKLATVDGTPKVAVAPVKEKVEEPKVEEPKVEEEKEKKEDDDADYYTADEFEDMDREELCELIKDEELDIDPDDYKKTSKLRKKLIDVLV
jgi:hypothetical protein